MEQVSQWEKAYTHGGDVYRNEKIRMDFSININPLGMPDFIKQAAMDGVEESTRYPDSRCRRLRRLAAGFYGVQEETLVFGNGAAELIFGIVRAVSPRRAVLTAPSFTEYEAALSSVGAEVLFFPLKEEEEEKEKKREGEKERERKKKKGRNSLMKHKVYIDGQAGTTGLQLRQKLQNHKDVEILLISEELRKDEAERKRLMNEAEVVFLCLPDDAAREAVKLVENPNTCIIDASTAHRTDPDWVYGFPELSPLHKEKIRHAKRIANPGCHATGFIAAVYPLIRLGIIGTDYPLTAHSLTGYSGGGKAMIAEYEAENRSPLFDSPRQYGLGQQHKHLPEMQYVTGIDTPPVFCPIVVDYYSGMATCIPLIASLFKKKVTKDELLALLTEYYKDAKLISVGTEETNFLASNPLSDTNELKLYVEGNDERMTLISVFDNLGKGASGAAVENMNLVLGLDETTGLL